jgi:hypothetical protein
VSGGPAVRVSGLRSGSEELEVELAVSRESDNQNQTTDRVLACQACRDTPTPSCGPTAGAWA